MDVRIDGVNIFNPLDGKLDEIIDCMVEFYGEKHRATIQERIKNTEFIFVPRNNFEELSSPIDEYYKNKKSQLEKEIYSQLTDDSNRVNLSDFIEMESVLGVKDQKINSLNVRTFNKILQFLKILKTSEDKMMEKGISKSDPNYWLLKIKESNETLSKQEMIAFLEDPNNKNKLDEFFNNLEKLYKERREEFNIINQEKENVFKQLEGVNKEIRSSKIKYDETINSFAKKYLDKILNEREVQISSFELIMLHKNYLEFLELDSEGGDYSFLGDYTKEKYVNMFKKMGYDYGDEFNDYREHLSEIPIVNAEIKNEFKDVKNAAINERVGNNIFFKQAAEKIKNLNLMNGSLDAVETLYRYMCNNNSTGAYIELSSSRDKQLQTILVCPWALKSEDHNVVHELCHIIESALIVEGEDVKGITGFDIINIDKEQKEYTGDNINAFSNEDSSRSRRYEAESEIVNDYFAENVRNIMLSRGIKINLGDQKNTSSASYKYGLPLIREFIDSNKESIIDSRFNGNYNLSVQEIGEDNYNLLADSCTEYLKQTKDLSKLYKFNNTIKTIRSTTDLTFSQAVYEYDWPEELQNMIQLFKNVYDVNDDIKDRKLNMSQ